MLISAAMILSQLHPFHTQNQQFCEIDESTVVRIWGPNSSYHEPATKLKLTCDSKLAELIFQIQLDSQSG